MEHPPWKLYLVVFSMGKMADFWPFDMVRPPCWHPQSSTIEDDVIFQSQPPWPIRDVKLQQLERRNDLKPIPRSTGEHRWWWKWSVPNSANSANSGLHRPDMTLSVGDVTETTKSEKVHGGKRRFRRREGVKAEDGGRGWIFAVN